MHLIPIYLSITIIRCLNLGSFENNPTFVYLLQNVLKVVKKIISTLKHQNERLMFHKINIYPSANVETDCDRRLKFNVGFSECLTKIVQAPSAFPVCGVDTGAV